MPVSNLSRRAFLRGVGGSVITLPFLEALAPRRAAAQAVATPRMAYLWFDLGVYRETWIPVGNGSNLEPSPLLAPTLNPIRGDVIMPKRVVNFYGDSHGEGPGDHARSAGTFLTCAHHRYGTNFDRARVALPQPTNVTPPRIQNGQSSADYDASVFTQGIDGSADQVAARLPSNAPYLLKSIQVKRGGGGDSYHGDVLRHLSWLDSSRPAPRFESPRQVFNQLFNNQRAPVDEEDPTPAIERSILATVSPAVSRLQQRLGTDDRQRLDRYLTEIRDLETKIAQAEANAGPGVPACDLGNEGRYPTDANIAFERHIDLTLELLVKAFECDITRIAAYGMPYASFSFRQDPEGRSLSKAAHNFYSHHNDNPEAVSGLQSISLFWVEKFVDFVQALKDRTDVDGNSLLRNSMVMMGCGMMDGNSHNSIRGNASLPIILAGGASGAWTPGRQIDTGGEIKLADIHLNMLRNMGYEGARFGDGDGQTIPL